MALILFVQSFVLSRFPTSQLIFWFLFITLSFFLFSYVVDPLHEIPVSYYLSYRPLILFSKVSSASLISQFCSFALSAAIGCTGIALFPRSTLTGGPQWTPLPGSGLEEHPSGQLHNLLNNNIVIILFVLPNVWHLRKNICNKKLTTKSFLAGFQFVLKCPSTRFTNTGLYSNENTFYGQMCRGTRYSRTITEWDGKAYLAWIHYTSLRQCRLSCSVMIWESFTWSGLGLVTLCSNRMKSRVYLKILGDHVMM